MTTLGLGAAKKRHETDETVRLRLAALLRASAGEEAPLPPAPAAGEPVPETGARLRFASALALDRRAVAGLTILLLFAVGYAVQHFWLGRPEAVPVPAMVAASVEPSAAIPAARPAVVPAEESAAPVALVVDVGGRVRAPGLHTLPGGSRVADALRAAGGALPEADTGSLNLARLLTDGEQILVGEQGAGVAAGAGAGAGAGAVPVSGAVSGAGPPGALTPRPPVSLNRATLEQLDALPGVGPTLAQRILAYRAAHGSFRSVDQLRQVSGIGARTYAELRPLLIL